MKRDLPLVTLMLVLGSFLGVVPRANAEVVRPAPLVAFPPVDGKSKNLASYKGQPIIVILADSPGRSALRSQIKELNNGFDRLSIRGTLIAVALQSGDASQIQTNVPLVSLPNGAESFAAFKVRGRFAIALIGPDGNLDYQTDKILNMNRIVEVMQNSYEVQKAVRR